MDAAENVENHPTSATARKKRRVLKPRSKIWDHFTKYKASDGNMEGRCNHCGKVYPYESSYGTGSFLYHLQVCEELNSSVDAKQTQLTFKPSTLGEGSTLGTWIFDQDAIRKALIFMIIVDELPFNFVESEGFQHFISVSCPGFKIPSRITISRDVFNLYVAEKTLFQSILKNSQQRVSLTMDNWTSIQGINYMCLTIHYIDNDWKLRKKIINFTPIVSHKGPDIGREVERCLSDWGIKKITTITVDNASSNDPAISYLKDKIGTWGYGLLDCAQIHMRCIAHIINLIVTDGLEDVDIAVKNIRNAVRFVRQSPARLKTFKECVEKELIQSKSLLCLDVTTRWNSTYLMLETAQKFQKAFDRFEEVNPHYSVDLRVDEVTGPPSKNDWKKISKLVIFLRHFYNLTLKISGSSYVTSNLFFQEIYVIHIMLRQWISSNDSELSAMAINMKEKFDKYWGNPKKMNKYIYIAAILDPRYKMEWIQFAFDNMYDEKLSGEMKKDVRSTLNALFNEYKKVLAPESVVEEAFSPITIDDDRNVIAQSILQAELHKFRQGLLCAQKSEVEKYLKEAIEDNVEGFDVLLWWKNNSARLPILSQVARDVLAIPISTVASESCFITGGRILDPFRSSLTLKIAQALICTQDWIKKSNRISIDVEENFKLFEELEKEFQSIAIEVGVDII